MAVPAARPRAEELEAVVEAQGPEQPQAQTAGQPLSGAKAPGLAEAPGLHAGVPVEAPVVLEEPAEVPLQQEQAPRLARMVSRREMERPVESPPAKRGRARL